MLIKDLNKILLLGTVLLVGNANNNFATASVSPMEYATDLTIDQTLRSSQRIVKNNSSRIPEEYQKVKEGLVIFKDGFKVFYGGPVTRGDNTIWTSPVVFERDELSVTMPKRVYELLFAMCIPTKPESVKGAELHYFEGKDIDLKFKNTLNSSYKNFTNLLDPSNKEQRVIIRRSDVAMVTYPDVFIETKYGEKTNEEVNQIVNYLVNTYDTRQNIETCQTFGSYNILNEQILNQNEQMVEYEPESIKAYLGEKTVKFFVQQIRLKKDKWKIYYVISKDKSVLKKFPKKIHLRIDSGCVGGQVYEDDACDCSDQFFNFISSCEKDGIVIHIPTHDGRGFGFAPKAETEIYKMGGKGKIHNTEPLDTVSAAKLLYQVDDDRYDIRDYDGVVEIMKQKQCHELSLHTDNKSKYKALTNAGITVTRSKTGTTKISCKLHILAKHSDKSLYF